MEGSNGDKTGFGLPAYSRRVQASLCLCADCQSKTLHGTEGKTFFPNFTKKNHHLMGFLEAYVPLFGSFLF